MFLFESDSRCTKHVFPFGHLYGQTSGRADNLQNRKVFLFSGSST